MAPYDKFAGVDGDYNFNPNVRKALAESAELDEAIDPKVEEALSESSTLVKAVQDGVTNANIPNRVAIEIAQAGVVRGALNGDTAPGTAGGAVGENGRATDFVFDSEGKVMDYVLDNWADRLIAKLTARGVMSGAVTGFTSRGSGGLVGENGRETDIIFDEYGKIIEPTIEEWAGRLNQYVAPAGSDTSTYFPLVRDGVVVNQKGRERLIFSKATKIVADGDSLTEGWPYSAFPPGSGLDWPARFKSRWSGGTVINGGKSGQSADEIALRQGGFLLDVVFPSNIIPAAGSVDVTTTQKYAWRLDRSWSASVEVVGVKGTLSRTSSSASNTLTFTRSASGDSVAVSAPVRVKSIMPEADLDAIHVIFAGRNDIGYASDAGDIFKRVVGAIISMVNALTPMNPRFVVVGTLTAVGEGVGSTQHTLVRDINAKIQKLYPNNFFDLRNYLASAAAYTDQKLTPDQSAIDKNTLGTSLMVSGDGIHYSPATADLVAAQLYNFINGKGWIV